MSWIKAADPLALVAIQAGRIGTPSREDGAAGGGSLDTQQRAVEIGEPVPIVFGRRRNGAGGIFISPGATEARFENDGNNNLTTNYLLVISEGIISNIPVRDVFHGPCRVGSHTQTYGRRAGTWTPGNYVQTIEIADRQFSFDSSSAETVTWHDATLVGNIWRYIYNGVEQTLGPGPGQIKQVRNSTNLGFEIQECPNHCGSVGLYPGMTTLSFEVVTPNGSDHWNRQVHLFIRGGMHVTRLYDSTVGPSDNFADLVQWMLSSRKVPSSLVDTTALSSAATFLEVNGFTCNCWLTESRNYADLLAEWAPYFLLGESNNAGKRGLRPLLPVNGDGTINTGVIDWEYVFTEDTILPGSLEIEYTSLADRQPFVVQLTWRQELDDDMAIIRTAEVRYAGTAESGPYESHDLSAFCTREDHAVKVGAYILAKRTYATHTIRFAARPQAHNRILVPGDIIRVKMARQASTAGTSYHDYLYQVERITKTLAGDVAYECVHFPIGTDGKSLVAADVAAATGTGILLTSYKTGVGCDVNSSSDTTIPTESFIEIGDVNDPGGELGTSVSTGAGAEVTLPGGSTVTPGDSGIGGGSPGGGGGSGPGDDSGNPDDEKDPSPDSPYDSWPEGYPTPNDPEWPDSWNPDPAQGFPYFAPVSPSGDWPPPAWDGTYEYRYSKNIVAERYNYPCNGGRFVQATDIATSDWGTKQPTGFYYEYGDVGLCGGNTPVRIWVLWHDETSAIIFQTAGASGIQLQTAEVSVEYQSI